jgi:topoisomerase IV subunit B
MIFEADNTIFKNYRFIFDFLIEQIWNYAFLNSGLTIQFNGQNYISKNGLKDLLERKVDTETILYPIMHFKESDFEVAITHGHQYGEEYYSFVNGQYTTQGGTHLSAFKEAFVKTIRDFYKKDFDAADIRASITAAVSVRVQEPVFESQTKTKLGSTEIAPGGQGMRSFVGEQLSKVLTITYTKILQRLKLF